MATYFYLLAKHHPNNMFIHNEYLGISCRMKTQKIRLTMASSHLQIHVLVSPNMGFFQGTIRVTHDDELQQG